MTLKALIVDDEYPARQELRYMLEKFDDVEVVGEAAGSTEALKLIQALDYDILFLDIKLPGINGLELAATLQTMDKRPHVIFITAYENYALDAFGLDAVDYVMKPIDKIRLKRAVEKVKNIEKQTVYQESVDIGMKETQKTMEKSPGVGSQGDVMTGRIIAESKGKMILVDVNDIYFAFTEGEEVYIKTFTERMLVRFTMKDLEARLIKNNFFRTHRSFIVNINKVKEIHPFFTGTYILIVEDKERSEVPVSRNQAKKLRKILGY